MARKSVFLSIFNDSWLSITKKARRAWIFDRFSIFFQILDQNNILHQSEGCSAVSENILFLSPRIAYPYYKIPNSRLSDNACWQKVFIGFKLTYFSKSPIFSNSIVKPNFLFQVNISFKYHEPQLLQTKQKQELGDKTNKYSRHWNSTPTSGLVP